MPSAKPRLLYVLHQYRHRGGTELQTQMLSAALAAKYDVAIAFPQPARNQIVLRRTDGTEAFYTAGTISFPRAQEREATVEKSFAAILADFDPQIIHFQQFVNWPLSIIDQALESNAPVVVSLYDYYAITPFY